VGTNPFRRIEGGGRDVSDRSIDHFLTFPSLVLKKSRVGTSFLEEKTWRRSKSGWRTFVKEVDRAKGRVNLRQVGTCHSHRPGDGGQLLRRDTVGMSSRPSLEV